MGDYFETYYSKISYPIDSEKRRGLRNAQLGLERDMTFLILKLQQYMFLINLLPVYYSLSVGLRVQMQRI